jgi:hypothetical protein
VKSTDCTQTRLPEDEWEAYLAGLIMADGHVAPYNVVVNQASTSLTMMEKLASHFDRKLYSYCGGNHLRLTFPDLPRAWKTAVPELPQELKRHYWRGAFDGDGCVTRKTANGGRYVYLHLKFLWLRTEEFVGPSYKTFLDENDVPWRTETPVNQPNLEWVVCRGQSASSLLGQLLYKDCEVAHVLKKERALS